MFDFEIYNLYGLTRQISKISMVILLYQNSLMLLHLVLCD
jgi:hypothetical protein